MGPENVDQNLCQKQHYRQVKHNFIYYECPSFYIRISFLSGQAETVRSFVTCSAYLLATPCCQGRCCFRRPYRCPYLHRHRCYSRLLLLLLLLFLLLFLLLHYRHLRHSRLLLLLWFLLSCYYHHLHHHPLFLLLLLLLLLLPEIRGESLRRVLKTVSAAQYL